jgi:hypothetical protein
MTDQSHPYEHVGSDKRQASPPIPQKPYMKQRDKCLFIPVFAGSEPGSYQTCVVDSKHENATSWPGGMNKYLWLTHF